MTTQENICDTIQSMTYKYEFEKHKDNFNDCMKSITDLGYIRYRNKRYQNWIDKDDKDTYVISQPCLLGEDCYCENNCNIKFC
tara:strand:- start:162 stop:410 length:249 start_codon:yes stop_codon:yes gene_type:complete